MVDNAKTLGEAENDLFRGRLSGLVQYDPTLQQRLQTENEKGTVMNQVLSGLQGSGQRQSRVHPMTEEEAEMYRILSTFPFWRTMTRNEQMATVRDTVARQQRNLMNQQLEELREEAEEDDETLSTISDASSVSLHGGSSSPQRAFARQLRKAGLSPNDYLRSARAAANKAGYDGRAVEFSDNDENKLMIYDDKGKPVHFGKVGYNDFILWRHLEKQGKVRPGYAIQKRNVYQKSHSKIKGTWASNKFSPNSLTLAINW